MAISTNGLDFAFDEFDQDHDGGWRPVAHQVGFRDAARMIKQYLDLSEGLRRIRPFHDGQMDAFDSEVSNLYIADWLIADPGKPYLDAY